MNDFDETTTPGDEATGLEHGKVYFMREVDLLTKQEFLYYKIGKVLKDKDVEKRVKEHQTGNPRSIKTVVEIPSKRVTALETALHNLNAGVRVHSGEWFWFPGANELDAAISKAYELNGEIEAQSGQLEQAATLAKTESNGEQKAATSEESDIAALLTANKNASTIIGGLTKNINFELRKRVNDDLYPLIVKVIPASTKVGFSSAALKAANPDLYAKFQTKEYFSNRFILARGISATDLGISQDDYGFAHDIDHLATLSVEELHAEYLRLWAWQATFDWKASGLDAALRAATSNFEGIKDLTTWKRYKTMQFDSVRLRAEMPGVYAEFQSETQVKESFKVYEWKSYN